MTWPGVEPGTCGSTTKHAIHCAIRSDRVCYQFKTLQHDFFYIAGFLFNNLTGHSKHVRGSVDVFSNCLGLLQGQSPSMSVTKLSDIKVSFDRGFQDGQTFKIIIKTSILLGFDPEVALDIYSKARRPNPLGYQHLALFISIIENTKL